MTQPSASQTNRDPSQEARRLADTLRDMGRQISLRDPLVGSMESRGLTPPQIHTLTSVGHEGRLSMKEIARRLGVTEKTVTGIVDRLERDALVRRIRDTVDRRVVLVELTESGEEHFRELEVMFEHRLSLFVALMDQEDSDALIGILERLTVRLTERGQELFSPDPEDA